MRKLLAEWRRSVDAQMPTVNPNPVDPFGPDAVDRPQANKPNKAKRKPQAGGKPGDPVDADWRRCRDLRITAVPTFVVGDEGVVGAQPYEVLERLVLVGGAVQR